MQRAIQFRKRLKKAGIFLLSLLSLAFTAGIRSVRETRRMNLWVSHTQEVLMEAASVRLFRARMQNDLWFYRASEDQLFFDRYQMDKQKLLSSASRLQILTADNTSQQELIARVSALLRSQIPALDKAIKQAQLAKDAGGAQDFRVVIPANDALPDLMGRFEATERQLFKERVEAVQRSAQWTMALLSGAAAIACGLLLLAGYYIQRELFIRVGIEDGLLRARELLGLQLNQQRTELSHAMEDLHQQITARNEAEDKLRRLNAELEARVAKRTEELAEMNRELESFNYSVSHDLRAPLRHMDGFSRILEEEFGPQISSDARHYLKRIRLAAGQMTALVDDLLQLARFGRQAVRWQRVSLVQLADEMVRAYMEQEGDRHIAWEIGDLPEVEADPGLLRQALANLISNALKFTKNKQYPVIEIGFLRKESEVTIYVKDNGAGFDPRYADKLFGVFQRLHRQDEFEGTGIGLAIVARIIHKHGGRVWAESTPECGATFYFTLSAAAETRSEIAEQAGAIA